MSFLGNVMAFTLTLTMIVIFLCVLVIGLSTLDYVLDSDIKGALVKWLGPRTFLKKIHIRMLKVLKKVDTPEENDIPIGKTANDWQIDKNYDKEVEELLEQIRGNKDAR